MTGTQYNGQRCGRSISTTNTCEGVSEHFGYFQDELQFGLSENSLRGRVAHMLGTETEQ